jgi:hypothetical protein
MKSKALGLKILVVVSLILTGIRTRLIVNPGYRSQELRAEAAKRSAAKNTASALETLDAFSGLKKEGNQ